MEPEINEARSAHPAGALAGHDREIVAVARLTALGTPAGRELLLHIHALLDAGGSPNDVVETILLMVVFAWVPGGAERHGCAAEAFAERGLGACLNPHPSRGRPSPAVSSKRAVGTLFDGNCSDLRHDPRENPPARRAEGSLALSSHDSLRYDLLASTAAPTAGPCRRGGEVLLRHASS